MITIEIRKSKKCNGDYSAFLSFEYNAKVVDFVRNLPSRYWNADAKEWEIPLTKVQALVEAFPNQSFDISGEYVSLTKKDVEVPSGFHFKTKPYDHQMIAFKYGLKCDRWFLGDEMGLGKTKQVIDIAVAKKLQKNYKHCLIVCGVNGLKWNWRNEVSTHSDEGAWILGQTTKAGRIVIGSNADKAKQLDELEKNENYFIITNIESLRDEAIVTKLTNLCKRNVINMIAFDECHKAKNPTSQQGKGLLKLQAETMIAMTGTPLMNAPEDLYIILKWLGYEKHAFGAFKRHYCEYGGYGGYEVIGYKNLDELQEQLKDIMLRRRKEEVLDLPEKTYIDEFVEMTPKQAQIYKEISNEIKTNIDKIKQAPNPLSELIRMRQATGYTGILSSVVQESAKLDRMEELVEEAISNNKKVVIFSNWTQITDEVCKRLLNKYPSGVVCITGETPDVNRQSAVNRFQEDANCKIIVGTAGAMGTGLTLTAGTVEIFMDEPWNMALKEQCVDRCHRIGQKQNLTIYTLMCEGTIDEKIHALVERKGAMADILVDGRVDFEKESMRALLEFLLG